jgi:hypothetical protein
MKINIIPLFTVTIFLGWHRASDQEDIWISHAIDQN